MASLSLAQARVPCAPFRVHLQVQLPAPPRIEVPKNLPVGWEKVEVERIGRVSTQAEFPRLYETWLKKNPNDLTEIERYEWLHCLAYYVEFDSNQNGVPDWSAIVDQQPARILFPQDLDQDGDGIPNILDVHPLRRQKEKTIGIGDIPPHLRMDSQKRPEAATYQLALFKEFGWLAIDHTDEHSPAVLRELLFLLRKALPKEFTSSLKGLRFLYAFAGHDRSRNVASYHWQAQALSIAGLSSYSNPEITSAEKFELYATWAHEIGHAVLFEKQRAATLAEAAERFAGWKLGGEKEHHFSSAFFRPFSGLPGKNMVSRYAMTNVHEWFAESFAAVVLHRLDQQGVLGPAEKKLLLQKTAQSDSWTDYGNLSPEALKWFEAIILDAAHH